MFSSSILKRSVRATASALVFIGMLPPAHAAYQNDIVSIFPDLPIAATVDHGGLGAATRSRSIELTSHRPWLAPVGHRQPRQGDVPQAEIVSRWERQQQQFDQELDRKLVICRGC
ncbi:hypothetical protein JQ582_34885 [Bradyrhizobium japonicum]|uniref:hypothetical protein n=1 Tax=Bradyrhizobium japonicum TaxID=375 RepID=UPI001BA9E990|nr:hypothetical protein [Bradyrhizobium japonicum]MBR0749128.1 hypothetical protein [Bradyrhizobium japonicum]